MLVERTQQDLWRDAQGTWNLLNVKELDHDNLESELQNRKKYNDNDNSQDEHTGDRRLETPQAELKQ